MTGTTVSCNAILSILLTIAAPFANFIDLYELAWMVQYKTLKFYSELCQNIILFTWLRTGVEIGRCNTMKGSRENKASSEFDIFSHHGCHLSYCTLYGCLPTKFRMVQIYWRTLFQNSTETKDEQFNIFLKDILTLLPLFRASTTIDDTETMLWKWTPNSVYRTSSVVHR
jgi:hypothetical protein